jgi:electron transport complex protein RnfD
MDNPKKFIVSHAPFWHNGSSVTERLYNIMIAALPAVVLGITQYGIPAIGVVALSVSSAIFWELAMNYLTRRPITIADGNAALIGLLLAMVLPATTPWWAVLTGTFIAVIVGKQIFGGIGSNAFNPVMLAVDIRRDRQQRLQPGNACSGNVDGLLEGSF